MKVTAGGKDTVGDANRIVQSIPASYTVWKDGTQAIAECNVKGGTDYTTGTDVVVIQNALDALTGGRTWKEKVVLKGNLTFADTVDLPSYTLIEIQGKLTLANGVNKGLFRNEHWGEWGAEAYSTKFADSDIMITGGVLDGNEAGQTAEANDGAISLRSVKNCKVINVEVKDFWAFGGIYFDGLNNLVYGNKVTGCVLTTAGYGCGIYVSGNLGDANTVCWNWCEDNEGSGIFLEDNSDHNLVEHNWLRNNVRNGIWLNLADYNTVRDNHIYGVAGVSDRGIFLDQSNNNHVDANKISNTGIEGIHVYLGDGNNVTYNKLYGLHDAAAHGLDVDGDHNIVEGNDLTGIKVVISGSDNRFRNNLGYITESSGTNTGNGGQQTIDHLCNFTPTYDQVFLSERSTGLAIPYQSAAPDANHIYVTAVNAKTYNWRVER